MILLTIATAVQFVILLALAVVVLSLARQVGILHERLSPAGLSRARDGIEVGQALPSMELAALSGAAAELPGPDQSGTAVALLFVAADCPICRSVLPAFEAALDSNGNVSGFWVADGLPGVDGAMPDYEAYTADHHIDPNRFVVSQELGLVLGVRQIPALVILDQQRKLLASEALSGPRQVARIIAEHLA